MDKESETYLDELLAKKLNDINNTKDTSDVK